MKRSERTWITVFLLVGMVFLSGVFAVQGSLLSTMIEKFQLDASRQGLANTMAFAGGLAALVSALSLQGRWRKRTLVKASILICGAGLVFMWCAPVYGLYVAAWFLTGYGLGLLDTLLSACMADLYTGKMAVVMMCLLHTAFGMASVLTPMGYAALLAGGMPWKNIYLVIAGAGLLIVLAALAVKKAGNMADREPLSKQNASLKNIFRTLHQGRILWLVAAILFHGIFLSGLNTWVNRYADGLGGSIAIPAQSCMFMGLMVSRLLMPFLPINTSRYVSLGGVLGGLVLAVGLLFPNGWILRGALVVSSLLFGALIPCVLSLGCERQRDNTLLATTGIMLAMYFGQGISSPMIAMLESMFSLQAGMFLCAFSMILCSLCCAADALGQRKSGK